VQKAGTSNQAACKLESLSQIAFLILWNLLEACSAAILQVLKQHGVLLVTMEGCKY
jgi:hypothetical protein